jgi:DNA polymerase-3 subunit epsilon
LQPVASVTKKTCDLLVAADPESGSGKAQKARQYGVAIMSVEQFLAAVGA